MGSAPSSAPSSVPKITVSPIGPTLAHQNLTLPLPPPQNLTQNLPLPSNQNPTQTQGLTQTLPPPQNNTNPQPENKKDRNPFIPFLAALTISGGTLLMLCTCMCCKRYDHGGLPARLFGIRRREDEDRATAEMVFRQGR
ncbi:MAG: hypothetical protein ACKO46_06855 [Alphaproteobacteria bacterium]